MTQLYVTITLTMIAVVALHAAISMLYSIYAYATAKDDMIIVIDDNDFKTMLNPFCYKHLSVIFPLFLGALLLVVLWPITTIYYAVEYSRARHLKKKKVIEILKS